VLLIEASYEFCETSLSNLPALSFQGPTHPAAVVITVNVKRTLALVGASISTATPKKRAAPKVTSVSVQFVFWLHVVDITSG
jgi:hypothetical protein